MTTPHYPHIESSGSDLTNPDALSQHLFANETALVNQLIEKINFSETEKRKIDYVSRELVHQARANRKRYGGIDAFMHEYELSSQEGILLMCMAEALLRIPDTETADRLIASKIGEGDWEKHLGQSDSTFVNASTWGLMLTGRVIGLQENKGGDWLSSIKRLISRSGEPVIREAMRHAMRILGDQFVLGRTIREALKRSKIQEGKGYRFSYDMLGEGAWTSKDAEHYYERYISALAEIAQSAGKKELYDLDALMNRPGMSIKLSALHPRYEEKHYEAVRRELLPKLVHLVEQAKEFGIAITIDAEEAERLDLSLKIFQEVAHSPSVSDWPGLGLAVQAYSKRALPVLEWIWDLSRKRACRIPVRLVKGAYWDSEIKRAQEGGFDGYPVFTRKANTDISYLACARFLLTHQDIFYAQFATHNAHTIAAIMAMAETQGVMSYEFQRLHGMGEGLYENVIGDQKYSKPCRIYAPVGGHEDLLAYLVRRLLENGANTSFVNRLANDEAPIEDIIEDPVKRALEDFNKEHPSIPQPQDLFAPERKNSSGHPLWHTPLRHTLITDIKQRLQTPLQAGPIIGGKMHTGQGDSITSPHDRSVIVGYCKQAMQDDISLVLDSAVAAQKKWDQLGGKARAEILERASDYFEDHQAGLLGLLVREAGKTLENAQADLREAVDFLRYYAAQARDHFSYPVPLLGVTGEENLYSLHGRGVFVCISPWNFPLAIFTGQVAAALAAGNAAIAKPAEQTPLIASLAIQLMHQAGVPADVLHFLPGRGETIGAALVRDERVGGIVFTGSDQTARLINKTLAERDGPIIPLIAETGGMNAMIIDSSAQPEQVVRDVIRSAFDSAGQRCSALRVLYLQEEIADKILSLLVGATEQLRVGDPLRYDTDLGPVIDEEARKRLQAHKDYISEAGNCYIDLPCPESCKNGTFVTPAIYEISHISQLPGEVFGPILHVIRYKSENLEQICEDINATGFGLTLGIHSRIEPTVDFIASRVHVGNIYINRNQIGAVVGVQPFGGEGLSGTGPKAGGPAYLLRFAVERVRTTDITAAGGNATLLSLQPVER